MQINVNPDDIIRWAKELVALSEKFAEIPAEFKNNYIYTCELYEKALAKLSGEISELERKNADLWDCANRSRDMLERMKTRYLYCEDETQKRYLANEIAQLQSDIDMLQENIRIAEERLGNSRARKDELTAFENPLSRAYDFGDVIFKFDNQKTDAMNTISARLIKLAEGYKNN